MSALTVDVILCEGDLECIGLLQQMDLELCVNLREVDEQEGVGAGGAGHALPDALHHGHHLPVPHCPLEGLGLGPRLYEGGLGRVTGQQEDN